MAARFSRASLNCTRVWRDADAESSLGFWAVDCWADRQVAKVTTRAATCHLVIFVGDSRKLGKVDLARTGVSVGLEKLMSLRALFYASKLLRGLSCIVQLSKPITVTYDRMHVIN